MRKEKEETRPFERRQVALDRPGEAAEILGRQESTLRLLQQAFSCKIWVRDQIFFIEGPSAEVDLVANLIQQIRSIPRDGYLDSVEVRSAISLAKEGRCEEIQEVFTSGVVVSSKGREIRPRTPNQKTYLDTIHRQDIVFCIGPAGTGKTYLAVAAAVHCLREEKVGRLILVRPAVEAGERLGFLPGALEDKVAPYLRPLYDALHDFLGGAKLKDLTESGAIEIAPLAYMRGRSLNDAFVILDEGQNTTVEQMKMFLTRLGFGSKAVITADITQTDLPKNIVSGVTHACHVLQDVEGIGFVRLTAKDVVRHRLVQKIIEAYAKEEDRGHEAQ